MHKAIRWDIKRICSRSQTASGLLHANAAAGALVGGAHNNASTAAGALEGSPYRPLAGGSRAVLAASQQAL